MKGLIFTYLMTYGGSVVALFNPFVGLLIYICFSIIRPTSLWWYSVPPGQYSRIIAIAMLVGWSLNGFGQSRLGRGRDIVLLFAGFWLWMIPSTLLANHPEASWEYVENTLKILVPFVVGLTVIHSWTQVKQFLWVMIGSIGFIAMEMNLSYFSGYNRAAYEGFGSLDNNGLAVMLVLGFGLSIFVVNGTFSLWEKVIASSVALLTLHAILFSFSRGGMLSLIITAGVAFFLIQKRPHHYLIFTVILIAGISLAGEEVTNRFLTIFSSGESRDSSTQDRLGLWANCVEVMMNSPIFGIGPANWEFLAYDYGWKEGKAAHTTWLQAGAEMGIPGLLFLVGFYGLCLKRLWGLARGKQWEQASLPQELAQAVIGALVGFIIGAQFVSLINLEVPYYIALMGAVVLKLTSTNYSSDPTFQVTEVNGVRT